MIRLGIIALLKNKKTVDALTQVLTVLIAALALILSQFPPLHELFGAPKVKTNATYDLTVRNKLGGIEFSKKYSITNFGDKGEHIKRVEFFLINNTANKIVKKFLARDVIFKDSNPMNMEGIVRNEFNAFTLAPFYTFESQLSFYEDFSGENKIAFQRLMLKYQLEYKNYMDMSFSMDPESAPDFRPSDKLQEEMLTFFKQRMEWLKEGTYYVALRTIGEESDLSEYFRVDVGLSDIGVLLNNLELYRLDIKSDFMITPAKLRLADITQNEIIEKIDDLITN